MVFFFIISSITGFSSSLSDFIAVKLSSKNKPHYNYWFRQTIWRNKIKIPRFKHGKKNEVHTCLSQFIQFAWLSKRLGTDSITPDGEARGGGDVTVYILFSECGRLVVVSLCLCQVKRNILLESSSVNLRNFNFIYKLIVKLSQRLKKIIKDLYNDYFYQKQRMLTFKKAVKLETCTYLLCMQVMIKYMQRIYNIYI